MENKRPSLVICSQPVENKKRKLEKSITDDLVPDIISRLPAKDLIRFTCVSKSWRSLIRSDPCFRRLQAQRTAPSDRHKPFLQIEVRDWMDTDKYFVFNNYWVDVESIQGYSHEINNPPFDLESIQGHTIDNPFDLFDSLFDGDDDPPRRDNLVLGSCHGLLLHQRRPSMDLAVSNPTTKKHVMLPFNPADDVNAVFCGFVYDRMHDCYKVVFKVHQLFELMVYDLTKGAWGRFRFGAWFRALYCEFDDIGHWYLDTRDDDLGLNSSWNRYSVTYVDGGVYWCIDDGLSEREIMTIVCFLVAEEEFHVVEPPDLGEVMYYPNLAVLDERLCLVCQALDNRTEAWSLTRVDYDDDGNRQSWWIKLFAMSDPYDVLSHDPNYCAALIPVCYSACRNKILMLVCFDQLFWYDLDKKEFRKVSNLIKRLLVNPCVSRMGDLGFLLENPLE